MTSTRPLQSRADCKANFDLIRWWISQCELHPAGARVPDFASKFQLPTRLIDIGIESDAFARLILSSDLDEAADRRYVALSHCWGDPSTVPKTVRATLAQHQERITGLSKTFEDAIEVARQIGVRYLWIDSLCIIQQDAVEWEIECTKMSFIYARAFCVISAMDAADGVSAYLSRDAPNPLPLGLTMRGTGIRCRKVP
jgi:Heterokaryon incompatibility protein (HET)